jgi:hypothetical protein
VEEEEQVPEGLTPKVLVAVPAWRETKSRDWVDWHSVAILRSLVKFLLAEEYRVMLWVSIIVNLNSPPLITRVSKALPELRV